MSMSLKLKPIRNTAAKIKRPTNTAAAGQPAWFALMVMGFSDSRDSEKLGSVGHRVCRQIPDLVVIQAEAPARTPLAAPVAMDLRPPPSCSFQTGSRPRRQVFP